MWYSSGGRSFAFSSFHLLSIAFSFLSGCLLVPSFLLLLSRAFAGSFFVALSLAVAIVVEGLLLALALAVVLAFGCTALSFSFVDCSMSIGAAAPPKCVACADVLASVICILLKAVLDV